MEPSGERVWQCVDSKCAAVWRDAEVKKVRVGRDDTGICPRCGGSVLDASRRVEIRHEDVRDPVEFLALLPRAFLYPFRSVGTVTLIVGTIGLGMSQFMGLFLIGIVVMIFMHGILAAYLFEIVLTTSNGEELPPDWPDFTDYWESVLRPFLLFNWVWLCAFFPLMIFLMLWVDREYTWLVPIALAIGPIGMAAFAVALAESPRVIVAAIGLAQIGVFYFPMALLAAAMFDTFAAATPLRVCGSIGRVFLPYLVVVFLFAGMLVAKFVLPILFQLVPTFLGSISLRILVFFAAQFVSLYLSMVTMRVLGILYRTNRQALEWF